MSEQDRWLRWRQARHADLAGPDSWLGVIGLFWLEAGDNRVGSGDDCPVRLPSGPAYLGDLVWSGEAVIWRPVAGAAQALETDRAGRPSVVEAGNLAFFIVERDGKLAVRLRDRAWAASRPFAGLDYIDYAPDWRIEADWQRLDVPRIMEVPNVSGDLKAVEVAYQAVFERGGQTVTLLPMSVDAKEAFFVFRDRSSGRQTYGAGRFLKVPLPAVEIGMSTENRKICLNFNYAFNPPCALTDFATCPLPPPENWLPFAVEAGELAPKK